MLRLVRETRITVRAVLRWSFFLSDFQSNGSVLAAGDVDGREGATLIGTHQYTATQALTPTTVTFGIASLPAGVQTVLGLPTSSTSDAGPDRGHRHRCRWELVRILESGRHQSRTWDRTAGKLTSTQPGGTRIPVFPKILRLPIEMSSILCRDRVRLFAGTGHSDTLEQPALLFFWSTVGDNRPDTVLPSFFNNEFGVYTVDDGPGLVNGVASSYSSAYAQQSLDEAQPNRTDTKDHRAKQRSCQACRINQRE